MNRATAWRANAVLVAMALGTALLVILAVIQAAGTGRSFPEVRDLVIPYAAVAVVAGLLFECALLATWRLLKIASGGEAFTPVAGALLAWIRRTAVAAFTVPTAVAAHLLFVVGIGGPGVVLAFAGGVVLVVGTATFLRIVGSLLAVAVLQNQELQAVV